MVFSNAKVAVFVDGAFWHGHRFNQWKHRLQPFWVAKIERNIRRDKKNRRALKRAGWNVIRVWEHDVRDSLELVVKRIAAAVIK